MSTPQPPSVTVFPWLRANLGKTCLAPLTGTDARALRAAVEIIELYTYTAAPDLLTGAFRAVVQEMQPHTRELAYHAIAHVSNWSDRALFWQRAGLEPIAKPCRCAYES